ncbi:MAG: SUMF1/EgtB/PvdO family nonheme iron enzyme [Gammaproteobacteria bacterium]
MSRVLRGGSWGDYPGYCRAAYRLNGSPGYRSRSLGFRVCRGAPIE